MTAEWRPCSLLNGRPDRPYAILVLNQPINTNALNAVIQKASCIVCADGGANWLRKYEQSESNGLRARKPDAIVGDLDSLTEDTEQYYRLKDVPIVKDGDQYSTDFTKGLKWIRKTAKDHFDNGDLDVVVLGGLGGRVDQGFSQIHHLYMANEDQTLLKGRMYLLSEKSLSFILQADIENTIFVEPGYFEENVGLIPIVGPATLTIRGFEWDVTDWLTQFGGQMSTSNHVRSDTLKISFHGKSPLFTMELAARLQTPSSS